MLVTAIDTEEIAMNRIVSDFMGLPGWLLTPSESYLLNYFWSRMEQKTGPLSFFSTLKQL